MASRIALHSPLPPHEVALKLKAAVEAAPPDGWRTRIGGQGTDDVMILANRHKNWRNSFASLLVAKMVAEGSGTRIEGRLGMPVSAGVFMYVWFGFLALFTIGSSAAIVRPVVHGGIGALAALPIFLGVPLMMAGFGVLLLWLGSRGRAADEAAILVFLRDTVQAS